MQAASEMAGFSLGEADILRRAIGKKNSDAILRKKRSLFKEHLQKGINKKMPRRYMIILKSLPTMDLTNLTRWLMRCCLIN